MKKLFAILLLFLITSKLSHAQDAKWDSTFRPNNYALKVEEFKSFPNSPTDIVFFGNSITSGIEWTELLGNSSIRNRGISGDITFGLVERLLEITEGKPAKVFVLIGINDISRNIPDSLILKNYRKIITTIKSQSPKTKIYFHTLLPVNNEFTAFKNHYNKDEHILFINREMKKLTTELGVTLIDLYPHFLNKDGKLDKAYTIDGLHINAAGYKVWAKILREGKYL